MPSWVAPSVAADYWNVSEEEIWSRVASGSLATRNEGHFCFVNVGSPEPAPAAAEPAVQEQQPHWIAIRRQTAQLRLAPRKAA